MKRTVLLGACLLTLCALYGSLAAGASAANLPEFSAGGTIVSSSTGSTTIETKEGSIKCTGGSIEGAILFATRIEIDIRYLKCENKTLGATCTSPMALSGEILTHAHYADLGYLKKESPESELMVSPKEALEPWMEFTCGTTGFILGPVESSEKVVVGKVTPVNTNTTKYTLEFKCTTGSKQQYRQLFNKEGKVEKEGELKAEIGGGSASQACLNSTDQFSFGEPLQIIA